MSTLKLLREIRGSGDRTPYSTLLKQARKFENGGDRKLPTMQQFNSTQDVTNIQPVINPIESQAVSQQAQIKRDNIERMKPPTSLVPESERLMTNIKGVGNILEETAKPIIKAGAVASSMAMAAPQAVALGVEGTIPLLGLSAKGIAGGMAMDYLYGKVGGQLPGDILNIQNPVGRFAANMISPGLLSGTSSITQKGIVNKKIGIKINNKIKTLNKTVNKTDDIVKPIASSMDDVSKTFKSELDWANWNKEVPDNKSLIEEYNAIDYRKNPLSDKEKEMYKWFDEQMRVDKLPQTTNKQSIEVLDNFKQRIRTPEGQKRLKELGITEEHLLQDLKIVEDPNTYGYYTGAKNTIAMNPNHPLPKKVVRHEIEHGVQNALRQSKINKAIDGTVDDKMKALEINTTEIDDILSGLTLRREGTPNKVWSKPNINEPVNINDYKSLVNNKQKATDYFLTGSEGAEKSAFLGEVQQYMMDIGKIPKDSYTKITPEMVKETMVDAMFDESGGGKYLRLFNIIKADPKNYEIISKSLNKMLSISPLIGAGAYMQNKEYKNGGALGNNVMFDMSNPNIYKSLVPIAGASTILSQQDKIKKLKTK